MPKCEEGIVRYNVEYITLAVVLEMGGVIVEDAAWLQKKDNSTHIDVTATISTYFLLSLFSARSKY